MAGFAIQPVIMPKNFLLNLPSMLPCIVVFVFINVLLSTKK
ncbi:hypothetical protein [uncultured Gammaproteobacteria bacterium]|nr:hypothetical protein [uncultured Gammaproteobacteria bacterium]